MSGTDMVATPVSAVIKVCALDTPYLDVVVPHMLRQARYAFAERILVADPRLVFSGKYARRETASARTYHAVLDRLGASGAVDRVIWAEPACELFDATLAKYFVDGTDARWCHDATGAPVYSALLGLEVAKSDLVVLMDADILFHASGPSWVAEGLQRLARDSSLWFVMTHAGPPSGPMGSAASLDAWNRRWALWDGDLGAWRFRHVTSRYFLADRRRLRGRLPALRGPDGLLPLEQCLSKALEQHGAYRANLALEGSWDLHVEDHRPPFPGWAERIATLVERGLVPNQQRGSYDLNLRRTIFRIPWRNLIAREFPASSTPMSAP